MEKKGKNELGELEQIFNIEIRGYNNGVEIAVDKRLKPELGMAISNAILSTISSFDENYKHVNNIDIKDIN